MPRRFDLGPVFAPPVLDAGGRILAGTASGEVAALEPASGQAAWSVPIGCPVDGAVGVARDGSVYVPGVDGALVALAPDGTERWRYDSRNTSPVVSPSGRRGWRSDVLVTPGGTVVAGNEDFHVYGLSEEGEPRFTTPTGLPVRGSIVLGPDGSVLVASLDLSLYAVDPETGEVRWRRGLHNLPGGLVVAEDGLAVATTLGGTVVAFDAGTGQERWRRELGSPIACPAARHADGWVAGTLDGRLVYLGPTGQVRRETFLGAPIRGGLAVGPDGCAYVAAGDVLHAVEADGARAWSWDAGLGTLQGRVTLAAGGLVVVGRGGVAFLPWDDDERELRPRERAPEGGHLDLVGTPRNGDVVSLRVLHRDIHLEPAILEPPLRTSSEVEHTARFTAEAQHLHLVPRELVEGPLSVRVEAAYRAGGERRALQTDLAVDVAEPAGQVPERFRLHGFRCLDPAVVEALDPAGLARLALEVVHLEDGVAWGLHRAGNRLFAFSTREAPGSLLLEGCSPRLVLLGAPLPLKRLRLVAHGDGVGSFLVEVGAGEGRWPSLQKALDHPRAALERSGKPFLAARDLFRRAADLFDGRPSLEQLADLGKVAPRMLLLAPRFLDPTVWGPWALLDGDRQFLGVGSFALEPLERPPHGLHVEEVRADAARRLVTARLAADGEVPDDVMLGVLLVDTRDKEPVALDYTGRTRVARDEQGRPVEVRLEIPLSINLARPVDALVLADLDVVWRGALTG